MTGTVTRGVAVVTERGALQQTPSIAAAVVTRISTAPHGHIAIEAENIDVATVLDLLAMRISMTMTMRISTVKKTLMATRDAGIGVAIKTGIVTDHATDRATRNASEIARIAKSASVTMTTIARKTAYETRTRNAGVAVTVTLKKKSATTMTTSTAPLAAAAKTGIANVATMTAIEKRNHPQLRKKKMSLAK